MENSSATLFPLLRGLDASKSQERFQLRAAPAATLEDLVRAKSIAINAYLSYIPSARPDLIQAFEKSLSVFASLLFEPYTPSSVPNAAPNGTKTATSKRSETTPTHRVTRSQENQTFSPPEPSTSFSQSQTRSTRSPYSQVSDIMDVDLNEDVVPLVPQQKSSAMSPSKPTGPHKSSDEPTVVTRSPPLETTNAISHGSPGPADNPPQTPLFEMADTMWNVFLSRFSRIDLRSTGQLNAFLDASEEAYLFYREVYQPSLPLALPSDLTFAHFLRVIFQSKLSHALPLLDAKGISGDSLSHVEMMDRLVSARIEKRRSVISIVLVDESRQKILLLTGPYNGCWSVPSTVINDGNESFQQAADRALQKSLGIQVTLDTKHHFEHHFGNVLNHFFLVYNFPTTTQFIPSESSLGSKIGWWFIDRLPEQVLPARSPSAAAAFRIAPIVSKLKNLLSVARGGGEPK